MIPEFLKHGLPRRSCLKNVVTLLVVIICLTPVPEVWAQCRVEIKRIDMDGLGAGGYDVFSAQDLRGKLNLVLEQDADAAIADIAPGSSSGVGGNAQNALADMAVAGSGEVVNPQCLFVLLVESTVSSMRSSNGDTLDYSLQSALAHATDNSSRLEFPVFELDSNGRFEYSVDVVIPSGQFVRAGDYSAEIQLTVLSDSTRANLATVDSMIADQVDQEQLEFEVLVEPATRISFSGTEGRQRRIDLGSIQPGSNFRLPVNLLVQSTDAYTIRFTSEHQGNLVLNSPNHSSKAPYEFRVDGQRIDMSKSTGGDLQGQPSESSGVRLPLDLTLLDNIDLMAGQYEDRINIEISPLWFEN